MDDKVLTADEPGHEAPSEPDEMSREIAGGPAAVLATLACLRDGQPTLAEELAGRRLLLVGTGASLAMAQAALPLLQSPNAGPGRDRELALIEAAELLATDRLSPLDCDCVVVAISKSGRSPELLAAVDVAHAKGRRVVAITARAGSPLAAAADVAVVTPIGAEEGAATKSELAALAALLALGGALGTDAATQRRLEALLSAAVSDADAAGPIGWAVAHARRIWIVGFGAAYGVASAMALLLHEKSRLIAVAATPSAFRHGLVEAAAAADVVVVVQVDEASPFADRYLGRLHQELARMGVSACWLGGGTSEPPYVGLRGESAPDRTLEAIVRAQQICHAAAHSAGTYVDGFTVLRSFVSPGQAIS